MSSMGSRRSVSFGRWICASIAAVTIFSASPAMAVTPYDGGDYVTAPPETNLALLYSQYAHAEGVFADGKNVDPDAELDSFINFVRLVRFGKIGDMTFAYQVLQPFGFVKGGGSAKNLASLIHDARFQARSGHLLPLAVLRGRPASLAFVSPRSD